MKFIVECDGFDGLVLMDQSYLVEMDSELLYSMDILLDRYGKSGDCKGARVKSNKEFL